MPRADGNRTGGPWASPAGRPSAGPSDSPRADVRRCGEFSSRNASGFAITRRGGWQNHTSPKFLARPPVSTVAGCPGCCTRFWPCWRSRLARIWPPGRVSPGREPRAAGTSDAARREHLVERRRELPVVVPHHAVVVPHHGLPHQVQVVGLYQEALGLLGDSRRIRAARTGRNPEAPRSQVQEHHEVQTVPAPSSSTSAATPSRTARVGRRESSGPVPTTQSPGSGRGRAGLP